MRAIFLFLFTAILMFGCIADQGKVSVDIKRKLNSASNPSTLASASISNVQIINNQLVITGSGLTGVTGVKVDGNSLNQSFTIETKSATQIIANAVSGFSFDVSKVFNLILSDAYAAATFPIDFSLCNATLNAKGFDCTITANDKDVLSYDSVSNKWKPRSINGLSYQGSWDANTAEPVGASSGDYYIVSVANAPYGVGDWIVWNGTSFDRINNTTSITGVFGRTGNVVATEGDYNLDKLLDVDLTVPATIGKVLKYDGMKWVAGDDLSGGGAGSVTTAELADLAVTDAKINTVAASKITGTITSAQILDGTIVNADINAAAAIDYSKLNIPNTTIPYAKLNIADGDIPAAKISGLPSATVVLATAITDADTTHAPDGNAVFDALGLKLNLTGGTLSIGTISGVPTPVNPSEVTNKDYVDTQTALRVSKAGDTMTGDLNINANLKLRGTTNYVTIGADSATATYSLTLPPSAGTNGYVLSTNGSGVLSWSDPSTVATGTGTVNSASITDGSIVDADVNASAAIAQSKIANLTTDLAGKEPTITNPSDTTKYYRGDKTFVTLNTTAVAEGTNLYFTEVRVLATDLLGLNTGVAGPIVAADTALEAFGKLQYQVTDLKAKGQWDKIVNDISYSAGNVGIGTATPAAKLEISGFSGTTLKIVDGNQGVGKVLTSDATGQASWAPGGIPVNSLVSYQVRVATTADITLSGTQTIDGVAVVDGDRVLVKNKSSASGNGVYLVSAGAWSRVTEMDSWAETIGFVVKVSEGSNWAGMEFASATTTGGTIGTTSIEWISNGAGASSGLASTAYGYKALSRNTTGNTNTALGATALMNNTTGNYNTAIGLALAQNTTGGFNVGVGFQALSTNTTGASNTGIGYSVLQNNSTGYDNTATGSLALNSNTTGYGNTANGKFTLFYNTTGVSNTASGNLTMNNNTTGSSNVAYGALSLRKNTTGDYNTAYGAFSLTENNARSGSTAVGYFSMFYADSTTTAATTYNTALGAYSLQGSTTAANNTGIKNTALGYSSLQNMTSGSNNIGVGYNSGSAITTGSNNIIIGSNTGSTIATDSNIILISDGAGTERLRVDSAGYVGIGSTTPQTKLDVNGAIRVGADGVTTCSGTTAGAMKFNSPNVEYCNGTSWTAFSASGAAVVSSQITDGTIVDADVAAAANIAATKLGTGAVDNTEFNYLNGVTSAIQAQIDGKQATDATLTSLAAFNTNGILVQTAADTFVGRSIAGTANRTTITNGDGVAGNPTINLDTTLLPSPVGGDAGKFLKATGANASAWSALASSDITTALGFTPINKAGDSFTTGTFALSGTAALTVLDPVNVLDVANKQYVDGFGQWTKSGSDVYRAGGNVGIGAAPVAKLDVSADNALVDVNTYGQLVLRGATTPAKRLTLGFDTTNNQGWIQSVWAGNNTYPLLLNPNGGNVGIGTTAPSRKLELSITGVGDGMLINSSTIDGGNIEWRNTATRHWNIDQYGTNPDLRFFTEDSSDGTGAVLMTLTGAGNVGVGTTNPNNILEVANNYAGDDNTIQTVARLTRTYSGGNGATGIGARLLFSAEADDGNLRTPAGVSGFLINATAGSITGGLSFETSSAGTLAEKMRIDNSGYVGIGTTTANQMLHVASNARIQGGDIYLGSGLSGSATDMRLSYRTGDHLGFMVGSGGERLRIEKGGNVGVGTTTPAAKLDVTGDIYINGNYGINQHNGSYTAGSGIREIFRVSQANLTTSGLFTITATRGSFVHSSQWSWSSSHNSTGRGVLTQLSSGGYSNIVVYLDVASDGSVIVSADWGASQGYSVSILKFAGNNVDMTANNTDWSTVSGSYTRLRTVTTILEGVQTLNGVFNGSVGIGTLSPGYKLDVQGGDINASGSVRAAGVALTSDKRWKRNIRPLENSIEKLKKINGVSYVWAREEYPDKHFSDEKQIGVIAQDVQKVFPELVLKDAQGYLSVNYPALIAPLIEAFKDQQKQIETNVRMFKTMQGEIEEIRLLASENKREIASLRSEKDREIAALKKENALMKARLDKIEKMLKDRGN